MSNDQDEILSILRAQADAIAGDDAGRSRRWRRDIVSYDLPPPLEHHGAGAGPSKG